MPIREQGQRYQFIRNIYIPAYTDENGTRVSGKSVSRMLFSWKKNEEPGADDLLKLDKKERAELERWQDDMKEARRKSYLNNCVSMLKRSLEDLAKSDSILEYLNDNEMSKIDDKIKRLRESRRRAKAKQRRNKI
jgi:hypothetical protein